MNSNERTDARMLANAIGRDDKEEVERVVASGVDVNSCHAGGHTLLMMALRGGFDEAFKALVRLGADLNKKTEHGTTVLMEAARLGRTDMARLLMGKGARLDGATDEGDTALHLAVNGGFPYGTEETVRLFAVEGLLDEVDEMGMTALMLAAHMGIGGLVGVLLERGAFADAVSRDGWTAMSLAARTGGAEAAERLSKVSNLWDVPLANGRSPLMCACAGAGPTKNRSGGRHEDVARVLLDKGADMARVGSDGNTAMDLAVKAQNEGLVALLFERGGVISGAALELAGAIDDNGVMSALLSGLSLSRAVGSSKLPRAGARSV